MSSQLQSSAHRIGNPAPDPRLVSDARSIAASYAGFVWRNKVLFVVLPLLFALAAAAWAMSRTRLYRAQMTAAVSRTSDQSATIVASFRPYLENNEILEAVVKEFKLDGPPFNLTRTSLLNDRYSVEPVRNTNLVRVQLRLEDPSVAAAVLARIGERAAALVQRTSADLGSQAQQALQAGYDSAEERLRKANTDVQEFKKQVQIDLLREDLDRALASRGDLENLDVLIAQERSRLASAEADLKTMNRFEEMSRTLEGDQLLGEAARSKTGDGLKLRAQYANPVYEQLAAEASRTRTNLAGYEAQRKALARSGAQTAGGLPLLSRLYDAEQRLSELEARQEVALAAFKEAANNFELARVRALGTQAQLTVVDAPLPPDRPEPRGLVMSAVTGAMVGAIVALALAVLLGSEFPRRAVGREMA